MICDELRFKGYPEIYTVQLLNMANWLNYWLSWQRSSNLARSDGRPLLVNRGF
jgi:hypothetical protein